MITRENYEEYIMMYVDGELTDTEEKALLNFLDLNPELKNELHAYQLTQLSPEPEVIFADKNALLKPIPVKRIIAFPQWIKYGVAACIAALVFVSIFKYTGVNKSNNEVAKTNNASAQKNQQEAAVNNNKAQPMTKTVTSTDTGELNAAMSTRSKSFIAKRTTRPRKQETEKHIQCAAAVAATTADQVALAEIKPLPCNKTEAKKLAVKDIPSIGPVENDADTKRTFWDKLPIDKIKKKELENISQGVANTYQEINSAKKEAEEKTLTIKIEKRKLILSF